MSGLVVVVGGRGEVHLQQFHPADRVRGQFLIRSKNPFYVLAGLGKAKSGGSQLATKNQEDSLLGVDDIINILKNQWKDAEQIRNG